MTGSSLSNLKTNGDQMEIDKERELYNRLIQVLEDALEKAAGVLGQDTRDSSRKRRVTIHHASEIYEYLCDLLDETLEARSKLR
jgi:hypothetical protein